MTITNKVQKEKSTGKPETNPKHCILNDTKGNPVVVKSYEEAITLANKNWYAVEKDKDSMNKLIGIRNDQDKRIFVLFNMLYEIHEKMDKTIQAEYMRTLYSNEFYDTYHPFAPDKENLKSDHIKSVKIQMDLVDQN